MKWKGKKKEAVVVYLKLYTRISSAGRLNTPVSISGFLW
jgi:hypothetical protein